MARKNKKKQQNKNSLNCTIRVTERTARNLMILAQMGNLSGSGRVVDKLVRERMYRLERGRVVWEEEE